jgi:hypothetical protein
LLALYVGSPSPVIGALTTMVAVPERLSLVAVITAEPFATAVTRPLADTVATPVLPLDQVTVRPVSTVPAASRSVTESCEVWPI